MASVYADPKLRSKRNYIAASTFSGVLYGYSTTMNPTTFNTTGALTVLPTSVTVVNGNNRCVQGRILRETGNRLYPDANPGVSTLMVQIYDANSGIRAYIDPNSPAFAVYNSDKPVEITDGFEVGTTTAHRGQPVFTTGDVLAGGVVRSYTVTNSTTTTGALNVNPTLGQVFTFSATLTGGVTLNMASAPAGQVVYLNFANGGGQTLTAGTNVVLNGNTALTNAKRAMITLVSDGTNFVEATRLIYT